MAVMKFALVLSLAILVLLPLCRPLEILNYKGAEGWPELAAGRQHQRIREGDRTSLNMRRLSGAITEPEPEPVPIIEPEPEPIPIIEPEPIDEPEPVPGLNPNPVITMPMPMPGSTASSAPGSGRSLSSVVGLFSLFLVWLC